MRDGKRILYAAVMALSAGALAYAAPAAGLIKGAAKDGVVVEKSFHAFVAACPLDWDQAPVARAMLSITQ